jgi:Zn-dependent protease with chaperone function
MSSKHTAHSRVNLFSLPNRTTLIFVLVILLSLGVFLPAVGAFPTALFFLIAVPFMALHSLLRSYGYWQRRWKAQDLTPTHPLLTERIKVILTQTGLPRHLDLWLAENPGTPIQIIGTLRRRALVVSQVVADQFEEVYRQADLPPDEDPLRIEHVDSVIRDELRNLASFWQRYPLALIHTLRRAEQFVQHRRALTSMTAAYPHLAQKIQEQAWGKGLEKNLQLWYTDDPAVVWYSFRTFQKIVIIVSRRIAEEFEPIIENETLVDDDTRNESHFQITRVEADAILYHELAHVNNYDFRMLTIGRSLSQALLTFTVYYMLLALSLGLLLLQIPDLFAEILPDILAQISGVTVTQEGVHTAIWIFFALAIPIFFGALLIDILLVGALIRIREYYADHFALQYVQPVHLYTALHKLPSINSISRVKDNFLLKPVRESSFIPMHPPTIHRWRTMYEPKHVFTEGWFVGISVWGVVALFYMLTLSLFTSFYIRQIHTFVPITLAFVLLATSLVPHLVTRPASTVFWQVQATAAGWYIGLTLVFLAVGIGMMLVMAYIFPGTWSTVTTHWDRLNPMTPSGIASNATITGTYTLTGTDPQGSAYTGTLIIRKLPTHYRVVWNSYSSYQGVGVVQDDILVVGLGNSRHCGVAAYQQAPDGTLTGVVGNSTQRYLTSETALPVEKMPGNNLVGTYVITGVNQMGVTYTGTQVIEQQGEQSYTMLATVGETSTFEGVGILYGDIFAVGWWSNADILALFMRDEPDCGVAAYGIQPDGSLKRVWRFNEHVRVGTEQATPR